MKKLCLFLLLVSFSAIAADDFWGQASTDNGKSLDKKNVVVEGKIKKIKKYVRSRSNYYKLELKSPWDDKFIEVRLYTIIWLKRMNKLDCKEGDTLRISGEFKYKLKKNKLGSIYIRSRDKELRCLKEQKNPPMKPADLTKKKAK